jgi:hypothetical protein
MLQKLNQYLETNIYDADVNNVEFLKAYGTHIDDGRSSNRAVTALLKAIEHMYSSVTTSE